MRGIKHEIASAIQDGNEARATKARELGSALRAKDRIEPADLQRLNNLGREWPVFLHTLKQSNLERWWSMMLQRPRVLDAYHIIRAVYFGCLVIVAGLIAGDLFGWLE